MTYISRVVVSPWLNNGLYKRAGATLKISTCILNRTIQQYIFFANVLGAALNIFYMQRRNILPELKLIFLLSY